MKTLLIIWQLPQYMLGLAIIAWHMIFLKRRFLSKRIIFHNFNLSINCKFPNTTAYLYKARKTGSRYYAYSLGHHIFFYYDNDYSTTERWEAKINEILNHEYGHSIQSIILGPAYLIVIGVVSIIATSLGLAEKSYTETWANYLTNFFYHQ